MTNAIFFIIFTIEKRINIRSSSSWKTATSIDTRIIIQQRKGLTKILAFDFETAWITKNWSNERRKKETKKGNGLDAETVFRWSLESTRIRRRIRSMRISSKEKKKEKRECLLLLKGKINSYMRLFALLILLWLVLFLSWRKGRRLFSKSIRKMPKN